MADATSIAAAVREAVGRCALGLRPDVRAALLEALEAEPSARGRWALEQLADNACIAERDGVPLCQDTGTVWVWVELGAEETLRGDLQAEVDAAVAESYRTHALRMSVARDALFDRSNTGDNTPAFIDMTLRPGAGATVHVMLKGGGSDNASAVAMLPPADGIDGLERFVADVVRSKGAAACPPLVLGVAAGGTFDKVAGLAKRALLRPVGSPAASASAADVERRLLDAVNATGIGPGGFGGRTTALAVHLVTAPCHIASLPVAVNVGCSAMRSASVEVA